MGDSAFEKWSLAYKQFAAAGTELLFPSETLVRIFKGNYIPNLNASFANCNVLDIGCGNGNNLIFLGTLGLNLFGTEVQKDICSDVKSRLSKLDYSAQINIGTNLAIPYPDDFFDYLVSWNVLHYENNAQDIERALAEYRRVLKPSGRFFISTTGPEHKILKGAKTVGKNLYQIGREDDFRKGQIFFYFDTEDEIKSYFNKYFKEVIVGRTNDFLFTETLDYFIVTGIK